MMNLLKGFIPTHLINPGLSYSSYNFYNSLIYASLFFAFIASVYFITKFKKTEINNNLILSLIPFVILDILFRLINDTNVFNHSYYVVLFSTPIIYLLLLSLSIISFSLGYISKRLFENDYKFIVPISLLLYGIFFSFCENHINIPIHVPLKFEIIVMFFLILIFYVRINISRQLSAIYLTIILAGLYSVIMCIYLFYQFYFIQNTSYSITIPDLIPHVFILGISLLLFLLIVIIIKSFSINKRYYFMNEPIVILLFLSTILDASASYLSYILGYKPQHVLTKLIVYELNNIYLLFLLKIMILFFTIMFLRKLMDNDINIFSNRNSFIRLTIIFLVMINFSTSIRVLISTALGI